MIDLTEETFNIPVRKNLVPNSKAYHSRQGPGLALYAGCLVSPGKHIISAMSLTALLKRRGSIIIEKAREYRKSNPGLGAASCMPY